MTRENYHKDTTHVSKSGLDLISKAPAFYYHQHFGAGYNPAKEATHYRTGTAFHVAVTEPQTFFDRYAIAPNLSRRTIDGREAWAEAEATGKIILRANETETDAKVLAYDRIMRMRDSVMRHQLAASLLRSGEAEKIITWIDPDTGAPCKAMLDWLTAEWCVDLKSTKDASVRGFRKAVIDYRYHVQAAFYLDGLRACGYNPKGFVFIACEKRAPYITETHYLDAAFLEEGRRLYKRDLATYMECKTTGNWPGYSGDKLNKISYE